MPVKLDAPSRASTKQGYGGWSAGLLIVGVGLLTRLLALPWADTVNGDAVSRTYWAWEWSAAPHWIEAGVWLPFGTYINGVSLWLFPWPFWTPVLLNIVVTVLTALCLWQFTRQEFEQDESREGRAGAVQSGGEKGSASLFVAIAFLLTPLAFRTSLMALSEPLSVLLLGLSLLFLAQARRVAGQFHQALLGGFFLTLAAAIRYEMWPLIPVLALLLLPKPKFMLGFGLVALLFPLIWMGDSLRVYGDAFYTLKYQSTDTAGVLAYSGGMTLTRRLVRLVFFPMTLVFGMTFGAFALASLGAIRAVIRRPRTWVWLLPFSVLLGLLFYKAITGTLNLEERYSLSLAYLLLPFAAELFKPFQRRFNLLGLKLSGQRLQQLTLFSMFPLGYVLYLAQPWAPVLLKGIERSPAANIAPIPRLSPEVKGLIAVVQRHRSNEPLWVWGFEPHQVGHLILFHNRPDIDQQFVFSANEPREMTLNQARDFLKRNPQGLLMVEQPLRASDLFPQLGQPKPILSLPNAPRIQMEALETGDRYILYRYRIDSSD